MLRYVFHLGMFLAGTGFVKNFVHIGVSGSILWVCFQLVLVLEKGCRIEPRGRTYWVHTFYSKKALGRLAGCLF